MKTLKAWWDKQKPGLRLFLLALATGILLFVPAIIAGRGCFLLVGDFNSQQVPFYMVAHDAVRNGEWGWNWLTDLGANFISSYSFYLLGSPFFWLTIPFPTNWLPYFMGPLLILKCACCALTAYWYLKRYIKTEGLAFLGALMYAFCGYSIYNIFFNHFHDVMVFFPLLLMAVDMLLEDEIHGAVAAAVGICALVNYFFFFGEVVFVVLYYCFKLGYGGYKSDWKGFIWLAVESVCGLLISGVLLLPSVLALLQNERLNNSFSGINFWVFGKARLMDIISCYFLPPQFTSKQVYYEGAATRWTSISAYLPIFGMSGVFAYMHAKKDDWLKNLLITLMIMSIVPIFNSAFVAFNASFYMRWLYMLVLLMILASMRVFEEGSNRDLRKGSILTLVITAFLICIIALTPTFSNGEVSKTGLFTEEHKLFFLLLAAVALLCWAASFVTLKLRLAGDLQGFAKRGLACVLAFAVLFGNFYIFWGKSLSYSVDGYLLPDAINGAEKITIPDKDEPMRINSDNSLSNIGMFWGLQNTHCFHSIVPASIVEFYEAIGEERSVNSKIDEDQYALRSFLAVHWYVDRINCSTKFGDKNKPDAETLMPGYTYYDTMAGYDVWENNYWLPFGFVYDRYVTQENFESVSDLTKVNLLLEGVLLNEDQIVEYGDILAPAGDLKTSQLSKNRYFNTCMELQKKTVDNFTITRTGFTAESNFAEDEFVFFSIPWEEGWSAFIDGEPADIEKVNVGFMAIRVPAGAAEIEFRYKTPGLTIGILCSLIGLLGLCVLALLNKNFRAWLKKLFTERRELVMYVIFGVLTTVVNYVCFALLTRVLGVNLYVSNVIAWVLAVLFAFFTNKFYVFFSKATDKKTMLREITSFFGARLLTLLMETLLLWLLVDILGADELWMKALATIVVIVANYILSKLFVFKKKEKADE